ncbi:queuosine biosynthesis protein QueD [Desulfovibrio sp. X2]|uniref:6-carboxytetrahydropterin synthase QueD n=1 Tax=Desulfovibrio sp. X2 TaxID=941449 RepID=UPI000358A83B|nr:6-carboxytetrahydropterin synthase QueD [Desulfovibrio sp. X2]EPR43894.1 queuosine biosynthesis protein QueD [Desulfovibrio sp. X2]
MPPFWTISVRLDFSASHFLRNYCGKCEALHGHNFGVTVAVTGSEPDPKTGMLLDYAVLKRETRAVLEGLDHKHLNECPAFLEENPSSENIARFIYRSLRPRLAPWPNVRLKSVSVAEKPEQWAVYEEIGEENA